MLYLSYRFNDEVHYFNLTNKKAYIFLLIFYT